MSKLTRSFSLSPSALNSGLIGTPVENKLDLREKNEAN